MNEIKLRVGIDVDGVLRDFCDGLVKVVREHYPQYLKKDFVEINDWQLENNFNCTKKDIQQIYWYDHSDKIMGNANPIYGAIEQMYDLFEWGKERGYTFVSITSQKEHAYHHTLSWLGKYELNFETVYFAKGRDKWKVDVDWLVDDSPQNWHHWKHGRGEENGFILKDRPYNQHINATNRVKELKEVKEIIEW